METKSCFHCTTFIAVITLMAFTKKSASSETVNKKLISLLLNKPRVFNLHVISPDLNTNDFHEVFFAHGMEISVDDYGRENNKLWEEQLQSLKDSVIVVILPSDVSIENVIDIEKWIVYKKIEQLRQAALILLWPDCVETEEEIKVGKYGDILKRLSFLFEMNTQLYSIFSICSNSTNEKGNFLVWEIYSIKNISIVSRVTAAASVERELYLFSQVASRRQDFHDVPLNAVSTMDVGIDKLTGVGILDGEFKLIGGFTVEIYRVMRDFMHFRETAVQGSGWVSLLQNGSIGGMAQQVMRGEADISIALSYMLPYRQKNIEFLQPIGNDRVYAFFLRPGYGNFRDIYSEPFDVKLWVATLTLQATLLFSILAILWIKNILREGAAVLDEKWLFNDSLIISMITILSQQGWYLTPSSNSLRILLLFGMVFGLILYSSYCAVLVSVLSHDISPINTLVDLLKYKFTILVDENVQRKEFIENIFGASNEKFAGSLLKRYTNDAEATQSVLRGSHTYFKPKDTFCEHARNLNYSDQFVCNSVRSLRVSGIQSKSGMFVKKNSPYKEVLNFRLLMIMERGINYRFKEILFRQTYIMCSEGDTVSRKINGGLAFLDVFTAFATIAIGMVCSATVLIMEILIFHSRRPKLYFFL